MGDVAQSVGDALRWRLAYGTRFGSLAALAVGCGWSSLDAVTATPLADLDGGAVDAAPTDGFSADTTPADADCTSGDPAVFSWTFDTTAESWSLSLDSNAQGSVAWTGASGDPAPGALEAAITPAVDGSALSGGWVEYEGTLGDLTGRTASAWLRLESGSSPHVKMFVQTGTQYAWADDGTTTLVPDEWTCLVLHLSSPAYEQTAYDPSRVISVGFEMLGSSPFRLLVDQVRIR